MNTMNTQLFLLRAQDQPSPSPKPSSSVRPSKDPRDEELARKFQNEEYLRARKQEEEERKMRQQEARRQREEAEDLKIAIEKSLKDQQIKEKLMKKGEDVATSLLKQTKAPEATIKFSQAQIEKIANELLYKQSVQNSLKDTGGVNRAEMVNRGIRFMEEALSLPAHRALGEDGSPWYVQTLGDCLYETIAYIINPDPSRERNTAMATLLRAEVIGKAVEWFRTLADEELFPFQLAASHQIAGEVGEVPLVSREELLEQLETYRRNGQWDSGLGDLMPQLASSFTNTPMLVIVPEANRATGYFITPYDLFHQPTHDSVPRVVIRQNNHFEPLIVPEGAREALQAMYIESQNQLLATGAIQLSTPASTPAPAPATTFELAPATTSASAPSTTSPSAPETTPATTSESAEAEKEEAKNAAGQPNPAEPPGPANPAGQPNPAEPA